MASFSERLRQLRTDAHMSQEELAAKLQLSKGAIGNYETGIREPNRQTQEAIADLFNVELDYLTGRTNTRPEYSLEEQWLISCYRKADEDIKIAVKTVLRRFVDKQQQAEPKKTKVIPLFPAAAGPTDQRDEEPFEEYETDQDADFAVRISGDSMEPEFHDGEVVLCKKRKPKDGEIAVISVNGSILVKQYISDSFGNLYLRSLNRKRKDSDMDILASGNLSARGYGTVIHKRIPLVRQ